MQGAERALRCRLPFVPKIDTRPSVYRQCTSVTIAVASMVDPFALGVTAATAAAILAKQGQDFVAAVSGHPGETIGTILGRMAKRRLDNAQVIGGMAHLTLLNLGVKPQEIPLPVLGPLLEGASFQDEPPMQEIWALSSGLSWRRLPFSPSRVPAGRITRYALGTGCRRQHRMPCL